MSSFGFGDVVAALQVINWIRTNCIDPASNAQTKYREFRQEVDGLEHRLLEFRDAFHQAIDQTSDHGLLDAISQHQALKQEADKLIGNFVATLTDCENLLKKYIKYDVRRGTFMDNAFWSVSTQADVEDLRRRIQAHSDKISLFVEPIKLRLATETMSQLHHLVEILMQHTGLAQKNELPIILSSVDAKFRDSFSRQSTIDVTDPFKIPLAAGIDIMTFHHRRSTIGGTFSDKHYLHLLKAHWLVEVLLKSDALKKTQSGHLYRRIIKLVQQNIAEQYKREEIAQYTETYVLNLKDFDIWPPKVVKTEPPLTEPNDREEMLAKLPVVAPDEERTLFVFRVNEQLLRIVLFRRSSTPEPSTGVTETFFDLTSDRLIPIYTITTGLRTEWRMHIFRCNGAAQGDDYPLQKRSDAFKLQQAFIGYETTAYAESVSCLVTYRRNWKPRVGEDVYGGEIQVMEWPKPKSAPYSPRSPPLSSPMNSVLSGSSFTKASQGFRRVNPALTSISEAESGETVVVTTLPPSPVIMAFTHDGGTYTFWQIKLDHVDLESSNQEVPYLGFVPKRTGKHFSARMLTAKESELRSWDLCTLFKRAEPSNHNKKRSKIKMLKCTHLSLHFKDLPSREVFECGLVDARSRRLEQLNDIRVAGKVAEAEEETPRRVYHSEATSHHRDATWSARSPTSSMVSIAPQVAINIPEPTLNMRSTFMQSVLKTSFEKESG